MEPVEPTSRCLDDFGHQLPADPESPVRRRYVQVPHSAHVRPGGIWIDIEPTDADDSPRDPGDEHRLARAVEPVSSAGPLLREPPNEAQPVLLALGDQSAKAVGR